ncbi:hypothetical protein DL96DRAFT_907580 [Flagelloscypha sp. PMI_526]|nr:hypothetical protein DL96DRAFT_907580 [Flagelloscypha sp. PMI_526]
MLPSSSCGPRKRVFQLQGFVRPLSLGSALIALLHTAISFSEITSCNLNAIHNYGADLNRSHEPVRTSWVILLSEYLKESLPTFTAFKISP